MFLCSPGDWLEELDDRSLGSYPAKVKAEIFGKPIVTMMMRTAVSNRIYKSVTQPDVGGNKASKDWIAYLQSSSQKGREEDVQQSPSRPLARIVEECQLEGRRQEAHAHHQ